jgi:hypothetical protein
MDDRRWETWCFFMRHGGLLLPQNAVQRPATPRVRSRPSQVAQDVLGRASGVFKGITEDGEAIKGTVIVDSFGQLLDGGSLPGGAHGNLVKCISDEFTKKFLIYWFSISFFV